jgi:hypothetical protein
MSQTFDNSLLICSATGEVDPVYLAQSAEFLAREHAGTAEADLPYYLEYYAEKLSGRAQIMRNRRRRELGLPDDQIYTTVTPFGKPQDGVRRSAF